MRATHRLRIVLGQWAGRRWLAAPAGRRPDWAACSQHPLPGLSPIVDYGQDRVVTLRTAMHDAIGVLTVYGTIRPATGGVA